MDSRHPYTWKESLKNIANWGERGGGLLPEIAVVPEYGRDGEDSSNGSPVGGDRFVRRRAMTTLANDQTCSSKDHWPEWELAGEFQRWKPRRSLWEAWTSANHGMTSRWLSQHWYCSSLTWRFWEKVDRRDSEGMLWQNQSRKRSEMTNAIINCYKLFQTINQIYAVINWNWAAENVWFLVETMSLEDTREVSNQTEQWCSCWPS